MPGVSSGTRMKVRPRWRSAAGSVRKMPNSQSANAPREHQVFWPFRIHSDPSSDSTARLRMPARSLPALGSDQPWHQMSSPAAMRGRKRSLLLLGARLDDGGAEQKDAVLVDPPRRPGPVVLLLEDQPLDVVGAPAAVLHRPGHRRPPALVAAWPPRPGAARSPRRCRTRPAARPARWPPARPGPPGGTPPRRRCRSGPCRRHDIGRFVPGRGRQTPRGIDSAHDRRHHQSGQDEVAAVDGWFTPRRRRSQAARKPVHGLRHVLLPPAELVLPQSRLRRHRVRRGPASRAGAGSGPSPTTATSRRRRTWPPTRSGPLPSPRSSWPRRRWSCSARWCPGRRRRTCDVGHGGRARRSTPCTRTTTTTTWCGSGGPPATEEAR